MVHLRYNATRKQLSTSNTSQEIHILCCLNTKDKSSMPEYLKYRGHGCIYTPQPSLIPLLRDVDSTVKEVVNPTGFHMYKSELIKVYYCYSHK